MKFRSLNLILAFAAGVVGAQAMDLNTLVERSPFAPPGSKGTEPEVAAPSQLEFRGIATDDSGTMFSVYDITANRGYWVREGEAGAIAVRNFNSADNQIEVEQGGRLLTLKLKRATIQAAAAVAAPPPTAEPAVVRGPNTRPAANPAADAQRLEAVAAEVRRRRALRNAAQGGAPAPAQAAPAAAAAP